jgi:hypothetical protein
VIRARMVRVRTRKIPELINEYLTTGEKVREFNGYA